MSILIETDRIRLRRWEEKDNAPFAKLNADPAVMTYLGQPLPRAKSDAAIEAQLDLMDKGEPAFWVAALTENDALLGCIGVKRVTFEAHFTPCYEIGWRLAQEHWGKGYATAGARAALQYSFSNWDMPSIHSFTVHANIKSQAVMERIGMKHIEDGDFDHPSLAKDDPLLGHVLYRIGRAK
jgi:3-dehydroquinate dehydratase/shikimate dehydrogenase